MKKTNIIHICGNNSYLAEIDKQILIKNFREKFWENSIEFLPLDRFDQYSLYANKILSVSLFEEKRMFVFFGGRDIKAPRKNSKKTEEVLGFEKNLSEIFSQISDSDFLVFYDIWEKEKDLLAWLKKHATSREYNIAFTAGWWKKFFNLDDEILLKVLKSYEKGEKLRDRGDSNAYLGHLIADTLRKLEILAENGHTINDEIIENFLNTYVGINIFSLIDTILAGNIENALKISKKFSEDIDAKNIEIFASSFIGNLRKNAYILSLRDDWKKMSEIPKLLSGISPYMLEKCYKSPLKAKDFWKFFAKIVESNIASKSGKLVGENILWRFLAIDTALFELKK